MTSPVPVQRLWPGETVVCIGSGPSLTKADVDMLVLGPRVIAVNDAYRLAPWADVLYACDADWWDWHKNGVAGFPGLKYALQARAARHGAGILRNAGLEGLESDPSALRTGQNSGYQAINLAVHLGAVRVLLLGYDMSPDGTKRHWFGDHPREGSYGDKYHKFRLRFRSIVEPLREAGVEVLNCSRRTALECFPRVPLEDALAVRRELAS